MNVRISRQERQRLIKMDFDYKNEKDIQITVCKGSSCDALKSSSIAENLEKEIKSCGLKNVRVTRTGCHGFCEEGPIVVIKPFEILYIQVKPEDAKEIVSAIKDNKLVERLLYKENGVPIVKKWDLTFYKHQTRYVMIRTGEIDPASIDDYTSFKGYEGLKRALTMKPEEVVEEVKKSGLRGRGGAGFSTGTKWEIFAKSKSPDDKYVVANADAGDPGSFMDRTLIEGDPFSPIEGMTIAAYATGANKGVIYVRAEYPQAVVALKKALEIAREKGYLGKDILGKKGFNFDIKLSLGAGAFVCGEETALINSVEGKRGMPRIRPPFPAEAGIFNKPTNINNIKSYAYVSHIIRDGYQSFRKFGSEKSPGTAVLCLTGKISNTGVIEVPMGMHLKDIIYNIGGGVKNNRKFKAVMTGGPSGGVIPESMIDLGVDFEALTAAGSIMGSGGVLIFDDKDSMVEIARFFIGFTKSESCGKCIPCREGTFRLYEALDRFLTYRGSEADIEFTKEMCEYIKDNSACGLGQTAPNPVLTTIKYFRNEYEDLIIKEDFKKYFITPKCVGCHQCALVCPQKCIVGEPGKRHIITQKDCVECGSCYKQCKFNAIIMKKEDKK